jgi:hypothetical protein
MGQKWPLGMRIGVCRFNCLWVLGDCHGIGDVCIASGIGAGKGHHADGLQVISRTPPRMLFLVHCKYIRVRLGITIMSGASVICCRGAALAW